MHCQSVWYILMPVWMTAWWGGGWPSHAKGKTKCKGLIRAKAKITNIGMSGFFSCFANEQANIPTHICTYVLIYVYELVSVCLRAYLDFNKKCTHVHTHKCLAAIFLQVSIYACLCDFRVCVFKRVVLLTWFCAFF